MTQLKTKLITSASAILLCSSLLAQDVYTVKNMSLKQALEKISKESKLAYIVDESLISGKTAPNIENVQGLKNALNQVLNGSGLEATIEKGTIIIKKIIGQGTVLEPISVNEGLGNITENSNSYTTGSMNTATKLDLSIRETPQSVKVLTQEYLEDANITSLQEMINNITGVSSNRWDERVNPTARGFEVDYYLVDGVPTTTGIMSINDPDLTIYDRVEIVKGANGLMTGAGNPSIGINMIRKHANSKVFKGDINLSAGSWDNYGTTIDVQTPLNDDGTIRARLVGKYENGKSYLDLYEKTNKVFYGVVDMDLTDTTYLSLGASYEKLDRNGVRFGGLPAFWDGQRVSFSRSKNVASDWTYWDNEAKTVYVNATQYLYDDISLNISYSHKEISNDTALYQFWGAKRIGGNGIINGNGVEEKEKEDNFDIYASIPFELGGLEHEIVTGFMYNKRDITKYNFGKANLSSNILDINNINIPLASPIVLNNSNNLDKTIQTGTYLAGKFSLMQDLKLIAGARVSNWEYTNKTTGSGNREFENELTPYAGLIYDIDEYHSVYASYTDIFKPQSSKDINGDYLDPIVGKNYETGIKGEYFDKRLNTALSIFRVEQDGVAEKIEPEIIISGTTEKAYKSAKGVVSKGVEFEMDGEITDNWNLSFGIANFEAKDAQDKKFNTTSSRTTANLFTKYKINKDFAIGGGLNYKSKVYTGSGLDKIEQDAYILANAMASYNVNKDLKVQLNINNLFDKKYYEGISPNSMMYGEPRSFAVNMKYSF